MLQRQSQRVEKYDHNDAPVEDLRLDHFTAFSSRSMMPAFQRSPGTKKSNMQDQWTPKPPAQTPPQLYARMWGAVCAEGGFGEGFGEWQEGAASEEPANKACGSQAPQIAHEHKRNSKLQQQIDHCFCACARLFQQRDGHSNCVCVWVCACACVAYNQGFSCCYALRSHPARFCCIIRSSECVPTLLRRSCREMERVSDATHLVLCSQPWCSGAFSSGCRSLPSVSSMSSNLVGLAGSIADLLAKSVRNTECDRYGIGGL